MAVLALIGGGNMRRMFTAGGTAIVTTDAIIQDTGVINHGQRFPGGYAVTFIAIQDCLYVARQFTRCDHTIVTVHTQSDDLRMVYRVRRYRFPRLRSWRMTGIAGVTAVNMSDSLAAGNNAIMTLRTYAEHLSVVNRSGRHRFPRCRARRVTGITLIAAANMSGKFSASDHAIMTLPA